MTSSLKQTFSVTKRFLIYNKSYSVQYFSALPSVHGKISSSNNLRKYICLKIRSPNLVLGRNFSVQNVQAFYDSLSSSAICKKVKEILVETHDFTGFSWPVTIIAASAILKLFIAFPCAVYQKFLTSKIELTQIEIASNLKSFKDKFQSQAYKQKWTEKRLRSELMSEVARQKKILYVKNNCHPFKAVILFLIQFPFWFILTIAIRSFAVDAKKGQSDYPVAALQFQVGGFFWCPNLSLPDPTFIIPTINFLVMLICTKLNFLTQKSKEISKNKVKSLVNKIVTNFLRLLAAAFFLISAVSPSGLSLFWASNSIIALAENLLIMSPKVKRFFKIPKTPSEIDKPFSQAWNGVLEKFRIHSPRKD